MKKLEIVTNYYVLETVQYIYIRESGIFQKQIFYFYEVKIRYTCIRFRYASFLFELSLIIEMYLNKQLIKVQIENRTLNTFINLKIEIF